MAKETLSKKKKTLSSLKKKTPLTSKKKAVAKSVVKPKKKVLAIPKGYHSITPYLIVKNAAKAIAFYKKVFAAKEMMRIEHGKGKIGHAELKIGDSKIMLADACPQMGANSPEAYGGSAVSILLYTKDVDGVVKKAIAAGAKLTRPIENMFYGDRSGGLEDPFGHKWHISTHIEDVSPAVMKKRTAQLFSKKS